MAFKLNPFTGNFDWVLSDAKVAKIACEEAIKVTRAIVTSDYNALGNKNYFYDPTACKWVEAGPQIVTDENGEVVINLEDC